MIGTFKVRGVGAAIVAGRPGKDYLVFRVVLATGANTPPLPVLSPSYRYTGGVDLRSLHIYAAV